MIKLTSGDRTTSAEFDVLKEYVIIGRIAVLLSEKSGIKIGRIKSAFRYVSGKTEMASAYCEIVRDLGLDILTSDNRVSTMAWDFWRRLQPPDGYTKCFCKYRGPPYAAGHSDLVTEGESPLYGPIKLILRDGYYCFARNLDVLQSHFPRKDWTIKELGSTLRARLPSEVAHELQDLDLPEEGFPLAEHLERLVCSAFSTGLYLPPLLEPIERYTVPFDVQVPYSHSRQLVALHADVEYALGVMVERAWQVEKQSMEGGEEE